MDFLRTSGFTASGGAMLQSGVNAPILFGSVGIQVRLFESRPCTICWDAIGTSSAKIGNNFALFSFAPLQQVTASSAYQPHFASSGPFRCTDSLWRNDRCGLELTAQSAGI
jgi:hypothetical protein